MNIHGGEHLLLLIPAAARSKAWVCGRSPAGIVGSHPVGSMVSLLSVMCCQVQVSGSGRSLAQRIPTDRDVSEYDLETSTMRPRSIGDVQPLTSKLLPIKLFRDEGDRNDRRNATLLLRSDAFCSHVFKAMNIHSATFAFGAPHMRTRAQRRFVRTYCLLLQRYSFRETLVPVRHTTRCAITQNMTISRCCTSINHREV
jgi:hypothetical protein